MKSTILLLILILGLIYVSKSTSIINTNSINVVNDVKFEPAKPIHSLYKTMYILDTNDFGLINSTLINIYNAYRDPRLINRLEIILVAFGKGYNVYLNSNPEFQPMLTSLQNSGCVFVLCNNTINAYHLNLNDLFPGVNPVPSGNGEIILRLGDGWTSIHP
ncbi:hypothetical protein DDB_G0274465 [Dictyostelium discoideum AX4]|uniref:Uncharacterized protein n=1 Tax=Dictyostelium discoideum TaxID=44689 RepID=Q86HR3_DICDI|nr:hypothetical protein DDB_G0274465 [Dictyostelium discoideum AX4]EAL70125.1 hypothetical protein DDB_G0274465 [Dictyostelium discoideum AX4]|eukprot:XP_644156.1 hypothetical protein DDB_G0274465 [Dictyostelium discoideum AX4]